MLEDWLTPDWQAHLGYPPLFWGMALLVGLYVLVAAWFVSGMRRRQSRSAEGAPLPTVSVVVAARNEEATVGALVDDLLAQDYPRDKCQIIVVDDGSEDRTFERAMQAGGGAVEVLRGAGLGKKAALSQGIAQARGEIILSTDADCRVPPTWMRGMLSAFGDEVGMVVGFSQIGRPGELKGMLARLEGLDFLGMMAAALGSSGHGQPLAASGQSLAFRRVAFDEVGGYASIMHRASGDDALLLQLIRRSPWRVAFAMADGCYAVHPPAPGLGALIRQRARWASNGPIMFFLFPPFFYYLLACFCMGIALALSPFFVGAGWLTPGSLALLWGVKALSERITLGQAAARWGREDLLDVFWVWALLQPYYLLVSGLFGAMGLFEWKGKRHLWGRRRG